MCVYDAHDLLRISFVKMRLANYNLVAKSGPAAGLRLRVGSWEFCTASS